MYRPSIGTVIALIAVTILAACGGSPAQQSTPASLPSAPPAEGTPTAAAAPTGAEPRVFPAYPCCRGVDIGAGVYRSPDWLTIPFQFTVGDGWRAMGEETDDSIWIVKGGFSRADKVLGWIPIPGNIPIPGELSPDAVWAELRDTPGLIVGEDMDIVIGGLSGKQFEARTDPDTEHKYEGSSVELPMMKQVMNPDGPGTFVTETLETSLRFILLPVAGRHMLIYMEASNAEFEVFAAQADEVLQTIQFQDQ